MHNGMSLSHKKEYISVSSNEIDELRTYYTEWSKLERQKQISYINACVWNLERWYWWTYLQDSKWRRRHREQTCGHSRGRRGWDELTEWHWNINITIYKIGSHWEFAVWLTELKPSALWQPRGMGWGRVGGGGGEFQERGYMYIYGWFMSMYSRNQQNIVKKLSSN